LLQKALALPGQHRRNRPLLDHTAIRNLDDLRAKLKRLSYIMGHREHRPFHESQPTTQLFNQLVPQPNILTSKRLIEQ